jgi:RNA polymerase primary sigma factor
MNELSKELSIYMKEIGRLRVMTSDREKELVQMMRNPDTTDYQKELIKKEIIEGNLRFVVTICKRYQNLGIDFSDLISEGNIGLMKAFDKFDWNRDIRFISYSKWWVMQSVLQSLNDNSRTVRVPVNIIQEYQKVKNQINILENGPSEKHIAKQVCLDEISVDKDVNLKLVDDGTFNFSDSELSSEYIIGRKLMKILDSLDERKQTIIKYYFGIGCEKKNLDLIGSELGLTKERIRQIKDTAIREIRHQSSGLFDFM